MADISNEIKKFREAIYGREVRESMISLSEKLNGVSEITERAEEKRVSAETNRVNAEKKRQTDTEEAIRKSTAATKRAEEAAEKAEGLVIGDISEKTVTFVQAAERAGIQSGDSLAIAFGKLAKYCADLKPHAFEEPVRNLTTTVTGKALDATMGKQINDDLSAKYNALNSALALKNAVDNAEGAEFGYDFLLIDNRNKNSAYNKTSYFSIEPSNESKWKNKPSQMPAGIVIGVREVFYRNDSHILVRITEFYPVCGRQYFDFYNVGIWSVWKALSPL